MRKGKWSLVLIAALGLSLVLGATSWAQPGPAGGGCGMWGGNLTPEQAGKLFDLKQKFMNDTASVRKQMMVKHAELAALWKAESPDEKAIVAKQKELNALRDQMQEKRTAFQLEARKIAPQAAHFGRGMGWGMGPHGGGMGPGGCPSAGPGVCPAPGPGPAGPPPAPAGK